MELMEYAAGPIPKAAAHCLRRELLYSIPFKLGGRLDELQTLFSLITPEEKEELVAGRWVPRRRAAGRWRELKHECTAEEWRAVLQGAPDPARLAEMPAPLEWLVTGWSYLVDAPLRTRQEDAARYGDRIPAPLRRMLVERHPAKLVALPPEPPPGDAGGESPPVSPEEEMKEMARGLGLVLGRWLVKSRALDAGTLTVSGVLDMMAGMLRETGGRVRKARPAWGKVLTRAGAAVAAASTSTGEGQP